MKILIFPCNTIEAIIKAKELTLAGHEIIGATSVASEYEFDSSAYKLVTYLPFLTEQTFKEQLRTLVAQKNIELVWSSIISVNSQISEYLADSQVQILSAPPVPKYKFPIEIISSEIAARRAYITSINNSIKQTEGMPTRLLCYFLSSIFKVPGESHFDKLLTIGTIFPALPPDTDIVEIGTLWGRTAKAFCCFSQYFDKGNVLCIDPWSNGEGIVQNVNKAIDNLSFNLDGEGHFEIFVANLLAEHGSKVNYLRGFSAEVLDEYLTPTKTIKTEEFGITHFQQRIGLLHIDGNHKYQSVVEDITNYVKHVVSGGWIIFDDYNWAYGDGVTKAADEYLINHIETIELAFFSGGALFVKLK